jgi:hypothetical protein
MAAREWTISVSSSFAALVSAVESLTDRGTTHHVYCETCKSDSQHDVPGATETFRAFFEKFAPGASLRNRRSQMYSLRSGISSWKRFDAARSRPCVWLGPLLGGMSASCTKSSGA